MNFNILRHIFLLLVTWLSISVLAIAHANEAAENLTPTEPTPLLQAVQIYTQDELLDLIKHNKHLERVKADRCQLTRDIEDRAVKLHLPAYEYLFGDMLAWGVCIDAEPARGIGYMEDAASQGLPAALEQLGRYYATGTLVQQDKARAVVYLREASALQSLKAQIRLVELFLEGHGSPYDYEDAYHWLYNAITNDKAQHKKIASQLAALEELMHPRAVREAKRPLDS